MSSCATYQAQYGNKVSAPISKESTFTKNKPLHTFYLIGDGGYAHLEESIETLNFLKKRLDQANEASTLLFLGDNIYPNGMPTDKNSEERKSAELKLDNQIKIQENFAGNTIFIPGNHDWYNGLEGLNEQEKYINDRIGKKSFLPKGGCSIEDIEINEKIGLVIIDSQWFLEDWDKKPQINAECKFKTREDFLEEFKGVLNDFQNKTTIVAIHHPLETHGSHGGQFSLKKQIFPLESSIPMPVIGSIINLLRKTTGASPQDIQNPIYREFADRLTTILADKENVIFVSGHDHNLQYIENKYLKQIISGSASKTEAARAIRENDFSYGGMGYAVLEVFDDQSSVVRFYGIENHEEILLFEHQVTKAAETFEFLANENFPETVISQIYPDELTEKGKFYNFLFGEYYRKYYSTKVEVPTLNLKDFDPTITPVKSGGGNQSYSLRLVNSEGKEFVMRGLRKSATRFIQNLVFKNQYVENELKGTFTEEFLLDFYTSSHPYLPFTIGELASPLGIYHTQPKLYYIPKQSTLGNYNRSYGNELYMLEERPMKKFTDAENFGSPDDIIGTTKMLSELQSNDNHQMDESSYIRARLFDMLIGDWDRHEDQWRWAVFKEENRTIYQPIPRDRDQVFPKYDGFLIKLIMKIPALRHMQNFSETIHNVKWFNMESYPLDLALTQSSNLKDWIREAEFIERTLTDEIIDNSFQNIPKEVDDEEIDRIKSLLKIRKKELKNFAEEYYKVLNKTVVLHATNKKDKVLIHRLPKGETQIQMFRVRKSGETKYFDKTYSKKLTKDIWIYGLNDDDEFIVQGTPQNPILIRLIGGNGKDTYKIEKGRKIRIYDYNRQMNHLKEAGSAKVYLSNDYDLNQYNYEKPAYNRFSLLPSGGYNPDDGVKLGLDATLRINRFDRDPYTQRHNLLANYYFATGGVEFTYTGTFAKFINKWNLEVQTRFTTPAYTINFFGYGNETENFQKTLGMDYNRVKIQSFSVSPSFYKISRNNSRFDINMKFEDIKVSKNEGRITGSTTEIQEHTFHHQQFGSIGLKYSFKNYDNYSLPTLGLKFDVEGHWITNLGDTKKSTPYLLSNLGIIHKITTEGELTLSTLLKGKMLWNDNYDFFQAAAIGGDFDMRSYRYGRFIGKQSFTQSTDLRLTLGKTKQNFIPLKYGILVGYDYGRVWIDEEKSKKWHQSIGGGLWVNGINLITGNVNYFYGADGGRVSFVINFGF